MNRTQSQISEELDEKRWDADKQNGDDSRRLKYLTDIINTKGVIQGGYRDPDYNEEEYIKERDELLERMARNNEARKEIRLSEKSNTPTEVTIDTGEEPEVVEQESVTDTIIEQRGNTQSAPEEIQLDVVAEAPKGMDPRIDEIADKSFDETAEQFGINVTMDSIENVKKAQDTTGEDLTTYMPTSILAAYRSGRLGEPTSREAKDRRNYFIMDAVFKGLSNLGSVIAGRGNPGSVAESAYEKYTGESFQRGMDQYFDTKQKKIDQIINEIERDTSISDEIKKSIIDKVNSTEYQAFTTKYGEEAALRIRELIEEFPDLDLQDIETMYWINITQGNNPDWQAIATQYGMEGLTSFLGGFK